MNELLRLENVSLRFPGEERNVLTGINLLLTSGERLLVTGSSGSGKSTLLSVISGVIPEVLPGTVSGTIHRGFSNIGYVLQNPYAQMVTPTVETELAFSLENRGMEGVEILRRIDALLSVFGLEEYRNREPRSLSGGECQRVALAAALIGEPQLLLLDEPTSFLDPGAAQSLFDMIEKIEPSTAVIMVEHRVDFALSVTSRFTRLSSAGKIEDEGEIKKIKNKKWFSLSPELQDRLAKPTRTGLSEGSYSVREPVLRAESLSFWYSPEEKILTNADVSLYPGTVSVLLGRNGSGKSTLLRLLAGIYSPRGGRILLEGKNTGRMTKKERFSKIMFLPQNPEHMFLAETVSEELIRGLGSSRNSDEVSAAAEVFGIEHLLDKNPFSISEGEKRRLSLTVAFLHRRRIILLDEPTYGLDTESLTPLTLSLLNLKEAGRGIFIVTHAVDFARAIADLIVRLEDGRIVS